MINQIPHTYKLKTTEMHTCGEPVRILESIEPKIRFPDHSDIWQKKQYFSDNFDFIRQILMLEPRGHKDMFGVIMTEPNENSGSDFGILFLNTVEYSPMCGHATIAIGRYLLEKNLVKPEIPETKIKLDCLCGTLDIFVEWDGIKVGQTKFLSVPAFVQNPNYEVRIPQLDMSVKCDIVYGGNFYAIVSTKELKLDFGSTSKDKIVDCGISLMKILRKSFTFPQSLNNYKPYLYGVLIIEEQEKSDNTFILCIFGEESVDRSPCGSGTTAVIANEYFKHNLKLMETKMTINPLVGVHSNFIGIPIQEKDIKTLDGEIKGVTVQISGRANFVGKSTFSWEDDDYFKFGFRL